VEAGTSDISVIIPYYNRERYIDEAVQSVLAQTLKPLEIIIVNDCSRASSRQYLDRYADVCKIVDLPVNVGLAGARNAGVEHARGEFIAFLDDDDVWLPEKLEVQRKYMDDHPDCAIVHTAAFLLCGDGTEKYYKRFWPPPMTLAQALMNSFWAIVQSTLIRREVFRSVLFDPNFRECEDREFIIRCCAAGYRVEGIDQPLIRLRREGQDGLTRKHWRIFRTDLRMGWKHRAHYMRAYGVRGIATFVLEKLQHPSGTIPFIGGALRRFLYLTSPPYRVKRGYKDPVPTKEQPLPTPGAFQYNDSVRRQFLMTQATSDISVIIPFYNRETYIDEAVQSVLAQTLKPLEIIIVNDCSKESSRRYLDRYADVCKIVDLPKNVGLAGCRNAGIAVARGKFIALLDDDDIWLPKKLEVQYRYILEHPECAGVHSAVWLILSSWPDCQWKKFEPGPMPLSQALTHGQWVVPSTLMIRTEAMRALGGFDRWYRESEDRDFLIRCCAAGYHMEGIDEPLIRFRRTGHEHLAGNPWRMYLSHSKVFWKHRALYYRAFGVRGSLSWFLESAYIVLGGVIRDREFRTKTDSKYGNAVMWRLHKYLPATYKVRTGYEDPVRVENLAVEDYVGQAG